MPLVLIHSAFQLIGMCVWLSINLPKSTLSVEELFFRLPLVVSSAVNVSPTSEYISDTREALLKSLGSSTPNILFLPILETIRTPGSNTEESNVIISGLYSCTYLDVI